ncbi:hypothetical protein ACQP0C_10150 [Nocardia sp. CA-129566]|uniref:hypothetical protein n=1 Tax=Nocardia sp. CA-129566 TaxID=3239976 RepID=UPI003D954AF7
MWLVEDTEYWSMTHNEQTRSIKLAWKAITHAMSADGFEQTHFDGTCRARAWLREG